MGLAKIIAKEKPRKFKVGDKVKVRKDLIRWEEYGGVDFKSSMKEFRGKKVTVEGYTDKDRIRIKEEDYKNLWSEEMFEDKK